MSGYDDYADRFLAALYLETEESGRDFHSANSIHEKYGIAPEKPHWISRMADDWEYSYFKDVSKVLGSYGGWSFRISPDGFRKVEEEFRDLSEIRNFLDQKRTAVGNTPVAVIRDSAEAEIVPASDRLVQLDHNSEVYAKVVSETDALSGALATGNDVGEMSPEAIAVAVAEVDSLRRELRGEAVRATAFWDRAKSLLGWISREAAGAVVGGIAMAALIALGALLGFQVPS